MSWLGNILRTGVAVDVPEPEAHSPVIHDLANILRSGPLSKVDLNRFGISEMGCTYLGLPFRIEWFSDGSLRFLKIGEDKMFTTSRGGKFLLSVAKERAERIFMERVRELEKRRSTPTAVDLRKSA